MTIDTLALVDNPAQFLNVLEWCHREQAAARTRVLVLAPNDPVTIAQLRSMCDFAEEEGIEVAWHFPRVSVLAGLRVIADLRPSIAAARRLVIGDPFAGFVHTLLPFATAREVVVVDDGTATMEFAAQVAAGEPLRRWHLSSGAGFVHARLAGWATAYYQRVQLRLFTAMRVTELPRHQVQPHNYDWARRRFAPPRVLPGLDVLGSSLVESGVVELEGYLDAVTRLAVDTGACGRYFAHRREDPEKLRRLSQRSGLEIVRPNVPLEIELRRGPVAGQLASFASSVGYTLPLVLAGVRTRISVQPLTEAMIRPHITPRARKFLERMETDMRLTASGLGTGAYELTSA